VAGSIEHLVQMLMRQSSRLRVLIEFGFILVLGLLAARVFWLIVSPEAAVATYVPRSLPPMVTAQGGAAPLIADRTLLATRNPFETSAVEAAIDAPETQLDLTLVGLFSSDDPFGGSASIRTPDNRVNHFRLNDEVLPGVSLDRILSDRVVLSRNGKQEILHQNSVGAGLSVIKDSATFGRTTTDETQSAPQEISGRAPSPLLLMSALSVTPVQRGSSIYGYRVNPLNDHQIFAAAGFENDDLLIAINGQEAGAVRPETFTETLGATRSATLLIERAGSVQTLTLTFEQS